MTKHNKLIIIDNNNQIKMIIIIIYEIEQKMKL